MNIYTALHQALLASNPQEKCDRTREAQKLWQQQKFVRSEADKKQQPVDVEIPGRPKQPELVPPKQVRQRSIAHTEGRLALIHSLTHIEFNAINLALDACMRFRHTPDSFITDWLQVACEEAYHFQLLDDCLNDRGSYYGAFPAHDGLWDMAQRTRHNLVERMALVPRVLEARGLDVTPQLIGKLEQADDQALVDILQIIYRDEIGHVAIGSHWYDYACAEENIDPQKTFQRLITTYLGSSLRGTLNREARLAAGFDEQELRALEAMAANR